LAGAQIRPNATVPKGEVLSVVFLALGPAFRLCCPDAILGGLADYSDEPERIAFGVDNTARSDVSAIDAASGYEHLCQDRAWGCGLYEQDESLWSAIPKGTRVESMR
jgi:hypothetical protein